ncbi:ADP-L-glycero-D-manno-heptose 6-epimerase [Lacibacter cauensis]|uniref:ADP-L-glycero-D-manno-heptose-6-epimerase n=1 Tax=Lacibacter cauensis TaxID=510947 RepID=A0A562SVU6_9BACT|nr:ADP-glyceromanno-heptose 6-epimerase [Lacibacter cauensis]TWI84880.1 ADP-L-glycero-D-manno-heptose 6-epimerase [Lacibacter cauensis]
MKKEAAIIVTGAAGFIGSCMVSYLNQLGYTNLILVDEFNRADKEPNLTGKQFVRKVEREELFTWLYNEKPVIDFVIHLGARTDTTEFNYAIHQHLNVEYSQHIWNYCTVNNVPLIYASSAATYGDGELGYDDAHELSHQLQPLNPYGVSKNEFDKWVLHQNDHPPFWAGLKFFNVYGPNEYHKARMASVIFHAFNQIKQNGEMKLFRSHKEGFKDGEQLRDFVYVKDVVQVIAWLMQEQPASAIYNLGTGKARSFHDLVAATFRAQHLETKIQFIDMPEDIRDKYQYFTEANMNKLRAAGYKQPFFSLEEGVTDYVQNYLVPHRYY